MRGRTPTYHHGLCIRSRPIPSIPLSYSSPAKRLLSVAWSQPDILLWLVSIFSPLCISCKKEHFYPMVYTFHPADTTWGEAYKMWENFHLKFYPIALPRLDVCHWSLSFLPSRTHAGKSFTYQGLRIWSFNFTPSFLPSVFHAGEIHLSRSSHMILWLYYLALGLFRTFFPTIRICHRPYPSCPRYLMRGRVTYQEVYASDSLALFPVLPTALQILSFSPLVPYAEESFTYQSSRIVKGST